MQKLFGTLIDESSTGMPLSEPYYVLENKYWVFDRDVFMADPLDMAGKAEAIAGAVGSGEGDVIELLLCEDVRSFCNSSKINPPDV